MSSYSQHTWATSEVISSAKLNNIEGGVGTLYTLLGDLFCTAGAGLSLNYTLGNPIVNNTQFAVSASAITLTASSTNYVYVNTSGVVTSNTTGFPTGLSFCPMAIVATGISSITSVTDKRSYQNSATVSNYSQTHVTGSVATTSTYAAYSTLVSFTSYGGPVSFSFSGQVSNPTASTITLQLYVDGLAVGTSGDWSFSAGTSGVTCLSLEYVATVSAASHTYQLYIKASPNSGTTTLTGNVILQEMH